MAVEILAVKQATKKFGLMMCALLALAGPLLADSITLSGVLDAPGQVNLHPITVSQTDLVTFTVTPGVFDAVLSIFDGSGNHLITNDDSPADGVNTIPRITILLGPGSYVVAVSACCAFSNASDIGATFALTDGYNPGYYWIGGTGTLSDGFTQYSCEGKCFGPYAAPVTGSSSNVNSTITQGPVTSVTAAPVPEPGSLLLLGSGLLGITGAGYTFRRRS